MKLGSPWMIAPDGERLIDELNFEVVPVVRDGRTLQPIAAIVDELGGIALWDDAERKVTIALNEIRIELWLDQTTANVNGEARSLLGLVDAAGRVGLRGRSLSKYGRQLA